MISKECNRKTCFLQRVWVSFACMRQMTIDNFSATQVIWQEIVFSFEGTNCMVLPVISFLSIISTDSMLWPSPSYNIWPKNFTKCSHQSQVFREMPTMINGIAPNRSIYILVHLYVITEKHLVEYTYNLLMQSGNWIKVVKFVRWILAHQSSAID